MLESDSLFYKSHFDYYKSATITTTATWRAVKMQFPKT